MTDHYVRQFMRPGYEPGDGSMDGAMLVDGEWWHPMFGCDSLQNVLDGVRDRAALAKPEPEGPTDEELNQLMESVPWEGSPNRWGRQVARAVLARWGHQPETPAYPLADTGDCDRDPHKWCWDGLQWIPPIEVKATND